MDLVHFKMNKNITWLCYNKILVIYYKQLTNAVNGTVWVCQGDPRPETHLPMERCQVDKKKGWNHSGCAQKWVRKPDLGRLCLTAIATKTNKCKDKNKNLGAHLPWEPS